MKGLERASECIEKLDFGTGKIEEDWINQVPPLVTVHLLSSSEGSSLRSCSAHRTAQGALPSLVFFCSALLRAERAPRHRPSGGSGRRLLSNSG